MSKAELKFFILTDPEEYSIEGKKIFIISRYLNQQSRNRRTTYRSPSGFVVYYNYHAWGLSMDSYSDILEHELESAVEVKDKNSLHRALRLIAENTVGRREYDNGIGS